MKAKEQKTKKKREEMQNVVSSILTKLELNSIEASLQLSNCNILTGNSLTLYIGSGRARACRDWSAPNELWWRSCWALPEQ